MPVDTWFNPYTLENNTVMHVANNHVQSPYGLDHHMNYVRKFIWSCVGSKTLSENLPELLKKEII